ncbi:RNA polymerase sigma factor [Draconibacterium sediminis]|uniref:RNA polymerase sigma factor n=1 Tax=Draconibacterium sediminis TaxID=1544798 RepID=UPI0026E9F25B|nr:RNA polymerase sigma-70 factor [Draconibacterium sediminis]
MNQYDNISDHELVILIKREEEKAFQELFKRYAPRIFKFAHSYLKSKNDADELVQIIFIKIWEKRKMIDISQNIKSFIFKVSVNAIYDFMRQGKLKYTFPDYILNNQEDSENQTWNSIIYNETEQKLFNLVNELPQKQQEIFKLSKIEGLTNDEIAKQTGLSKRTVENHLYRAIAFLKRNFEANPLIALLFYLTFR